jgi:hypothetical protein
MRGEWITLLSKTGTLACLARLRYDTSGQARVPVLLEPPAVNIVDRCQ